MNQTPSTARLRRHSQAMRQLLAALCEGRWRRMALGILLACTTALMGALLLGISGWFITATAIAGMSLTTALVFDVFMPSASIRLLAIGRTGARYGERVVSHSAALQALVGVRERLFRSFARADAQQSRRWQLQPARLLLRLTRDLNAAESLYLRLLLPSCAALATTLGISAWLAWHHVWLGLACLVWFLGWGLGITVWLVHATTRLTLQQSRHAEQLRQQALDLVGGQAELVMAGQYDAWQQRLMRKEAQVANLDAQLQRRDATAAAAWQILHSLTMAAAVGCAAWLVLRHGMSVANGAFLILMAMAGMEPFAAMRRGAMEWAATLLAAQRLEQPLRTSQATAAKATKAPHPTAPAAPFGATGTTAHTLDGTVMLPAPAPGLAAQLRQVWLYGPRNEVRVADASLDIARGETLAIVGASGSGKSSLLALLAGELAASAGQVRALPCVALPQQTALFNDTVRANINLQQRTLPDAALWATLEAAGLKDVIAARGKGLDEWLGEAGLGLSKGQGRRLALARLFLTDSSFWLLDEPTDGLDADTARDVLERLAYTLGDKTAVIATHMRREAALADRLLLMDAGRITGQAVRGTPQFDDVLARLREG